MAKKKKFHPGGNVPPRRPILERRPTPVARPPIAGQRVAAPRGTVTTPARRPRKVDQLEKNSRAMQRQIFKELGFGSQRAFNTAMRNASPAEQRKMNDRYRTVGSRLSRQFNIDNKDLIAQRRAADEARRKAAMERRRNARIQPMMPTSGMDRMGGRQVRGNVAMPGPAPDAQRMRRMQDLMRRQRQFFNQNRRTTRTQSPAERLQAGSFNFNPNSQRQQEARRRMEQGMRGLMKEPRRPRTPRRPRRRR